MGNWPTKAARVQHICVLYGRETISPFSISQSPVKVTSLAFDLQFMQLQLPYLGSFTCSGSSSSAEGGGQLDMRHVHLLSNQISIRRSRAAEFHPVIAKESDKGID